MQVLFVDNIKNCDYFNTIFYDPRTNRYYMSIRVLGRNVFHIRPVYVFMNELESMDHNRKQFIIQNGLTAAYNKEFSMYQEKTNMQQVYLEFINEIRQTK